MKENYLYQRTFAFLANTKLFVYKKIYAALFVCLVSMSSIGAWAQSAQVINETGGTGLNDGLKIVVNTNGALSVYRNNRTQYYSGYQWPSGQGAGVTLRFRFSKGSTYNTTTASFTTCSTTPVKKIGNQYTTSITGWVKSPISSDLFYVTIDVTYTHPNNFFYVDYFVRAPSNLSAAGQNQLVHMYLDHDTYILGKDGSRGYRSSNGTGEVIGNYRLSSDNSGCGGGSNNPVYPSTHGFKTKNGFRSYYTGPYSSRNNIGADLKLTNRLNTSCVDDGVAVEFTVGPFTTAGQVLAKQVLHGYGNNKGEFDNTPVNDPAVPTIPSSPVTVEFTSNAYSESEGNADHQTNTVKLRVSGGVLHQPQACNFTISGGTAQQNTDYSYVKGFTIPAGNYTTAQEFVLDNITIKGNSICQNNRTFTISIDNPGQCNDLIVKNGTNNQAVFTIEDDEPRPTITTALPNLVYHHGQTVPAISLASNTAGTTFSWANTNTSIGLGASGTGNIPSFTASNTSTSPITGTITVTPRKDCDGTPKSYTITVNPQFTITYDHSQGTPPTSANPTTYLYNQSVTISNEPTRTGYTFKGWICPDLSITTPQKPFVIPSTANRNLTLVADWGEDIYNITYTLDGGVVQGGTNPATYTVTTPTFTLKHPKKAGHTFIGWTGTNGTSPQMTVTVPKGSTGARNYTANYTENTYQINYNNASGVAAATPNKATYKITEVPFSINSTAPANQPRRNGYNFAGWTGPNAATPLKIVNVTNAVFTSSGDPQDLTYTANWTPINYTIDYHMAGGIQIPQGSYNIETPNFNLPTALRDHYTFTGWTGDNGATPQTTVTIATGSTGNRNYTANWTPVNYTITYQTAGGNAIPQGSYNVETPQFNLPVPVRTHYIFEGWTGPDVSMPQVTVPIPQGTTGNRTYTAHWSPKPYQITYTLNGATTTPSNPTQYNIESSPIALVNPQKTGYDFKGWSGTGVTGQSTSVNIPTGSTGDRSYTANWSPTVYTITYNYNGPTSGLPTNPANYNIESSAIQLNNPTWTGRTFLGWSGTDITGTSTSVTIPQGSMGNRTYTANWDEDEYTITYDLDGGVEGSPANPVKYKVSTPTFTLTNPTKSGYTFAGWTGTNLGAATTTVTVTTGSTGARSYTATWTPITYNIKYVDDDGTTVFSSSALSAGAPTQFDDTELPKTFTVTATKPGWTFAGWELGAGAGGTPSVTIPKASASHANQTYKAKWTVIDYNITYTLDGGTAGTPANPSTYQVTSAPIALTPPTRSGYTFAGWTGTGLTTPTVAVTIPTGSTGARSYTATWTPVTYNIKYVDDDGTTQLTTVSSGAPTQFDDTQLPKTFTVTATKPGWTFVGWSGGAGASGGSGITIPKVPASHAHQTYQAIWTADDYTITFNANGGNNPTIPANLTGYKMTTLPVTANITPTRTGYTFTGWTGHGQNNQTAPFTITSSTTGVPGNLVYNAGWNINTYNITYTLDGGTASGNPSTYQVTTPDIALVNPTKPGWTFAGWTGTDLTAPSQSVTIPQGSVGARNYTATWTANAYTITFDPNGGVNPTSIPTQWLGYDMTDLPLNAISVTPTRTGYTFAGWTGPGQANQTAPFSITTATPTVPGNLVYTAGWNIVTYNITYTLDGGTASGNPSTYQVTTPAITLTNPTRTGWTFAGWTGTDLSGATQSVTIPTGSIGNRAYTATWTENGYTITYNYNNGTAPTTANKASFKITEVPFVVNTTASANQPTRTGYDFTGWTGHDITTPNQTINVQASTFSTSGVPENLSYTANWTPITYNIDYDTDGGVAIPQGNYTIETPTFTLPTPSKSGWTFAGWTGSNGTTPQPTVSVTQGSTGNLSYTANWSANAYTITFDSNGGVNPSIPSNLTGYNVTQLPLTVNLTPTRLGYTFKGWKLSGSTMLPLTGTFTIDGTTPGVPGNLRFVAEWEEDEYMIIYHTDTSVGVLNPGNSDRYKITQLPKTVGLLEPAPYDPKNVFIGWTIRELPAVPLGLSVEIPANTTGDLHLDAHWAKTLNDLNNNSGGIKDSLFVCEGPRTLYGDPQGKSRQWILPDSTQVTTVNVNATKSGRYVCITNYGNKILNDTLYVYFLMERSNSEIEYITTTGAKLNRSQEFVLNIPREMWPHVTSNWSVSGGGVIIRASADSLVATWSYTGEKTVSVDFTFNYAGTSCSKRLTTKLQITQRSLGFFVDHTAVNGKKDGSSWEDAHLTIQDALAVATVGDRIWVAKGTYKPVSGQAFEILQDSIEIYGGFDGTEEYLFQRNIFENKSITKGNGASVWKVGNSSGVRIDGFVIEGGRADKGAGILFQNSSGTIMNNVIRNNTATSAGGGVYMPAPWLGKPNSVIANTEISGNQSPQGAGLFNDGGDMRLLNVTISGNKGETGAGLYNAGGNPYIANSIIWGNLSTTGDKLTNDVLNDGGGKPVYTYNLIGGSEKAGGGWNDALGINNKGNKDRNPLFYRKGFEEDGVTMRRGDYRLTSASAAVDAGLNYEASVGVKTPWDVLLQYPKPSLRDGLLFDLLYNKRINESRIDMGAYESGATRFDVDVLSRPVCLPKIEGLTTTPGPGIHYVQSQDNFVFTIAAEPGYTLDNLTVTTGVPYRDKDGILMEKNADGSVKVTILKVWEPLDVSINGIGPVSNSLLPSHKVWAYKQHLHIEALYSAMLQIYTMDGKLYIQKFVEEGDTTIPLSSGFYTVVLDGKVYKVMLQ